MKILCENSTSQANIFGQEFISLWKKGKAKLKKTGYPNRKIMKDQKYSKSLEIQRMKFWRLSLFLVEFIQDTKLFFLKLHV